MRAIIGVTTSELRRGELSTLRRHGEPAHPEMALGITYLQAVDAAGGLPVVLPPLAPDRVDQMLDRLDGIVLSGGPDLDPQAYGARERHAELGPTEPGLDDFELTLARAALQRGVPLLGVCRGCQTLNVACGGTLHQHVPGHRQTEAATQETHVVDLEPGTRLARLAGAGALAVNSFHHQAADRLGEGLRVAARAPDGTIEAIEGPGFALGVQWHAETLADREPHHTLFRALVSAASNERLPLAA